MKRLMMLFMAGTAMMGVSAANADPIQINDNDEGYSRLSRWEQHLDDKIAGGVNSGALNARKAWRIQKNLDSIEAHVLQSYYESDNGIDRNTFRTYAGQLRNIAGQLGETGWGAQNIYGGGWYDQGDPNWHGGGPNWNGGNPPPPPPPQGGPGWNGGNPPPPPPGGYYYRQGDYEQSCRQGNAAAGTIFGAVAGGLLGGAISHGNGGAIVGGVVVGGVLGNSLSRDIDCDDRSYAFSSYDAALNGDVGRDYDWNHGNNRGTFRTVREYRDGDRVCRDFHVVSYRDGQRYERDGTACRSPGSNWETR
jgi:surface antigen